MGTVDSRRGAREMRAETPQSEASDTPDPSSVRARGSLLDSHMPEDQSSHAIGNSKKQR